MTFSDFSRISEKNCHLLTIFEAVRPHLQMSFGNILSHINTIYVLKTKSGVMSISERYLRLKVCSRKIAVCSSVTRVFLSCRVK